MTFVIRREPRLPLSWMYPRAPKRKMPAPFEDRPTYYFSLARNGIYHGLRALSISPGDIILVPSFHCSSVVDAILAYGADVRFFDIHLDCTPNFSDILSKISNKVRAVLLIHYFGFPQQLDEILKICKAQHLYLIEDCAHVLTGHVNGMTLGTVGDISIFSWRKFLPLFDGGQLVINTDKIDLDIPWSGTSSPSLTKVLKKLAIDHIFFSTAKTSRMRSRFLEYGYALKKRLISKTKPPSMNSDASCVNLRISKLSKYIMQNADLSLIAKKRRMNALFLLQALETITQVSPLYPALPKGVSPWVFPVLSQDGPKLFNHLRTNGIPAYTWRNLNHDKLNIKNFRNAHILYNNIVFLPIHQSLDYSDINHIIAVINRVS